MNSIKYLIALVMATLALTAGAAEKKVLVHGWSGPLGGGYWLHNMSKTETLTVRVQTETYWRGKWEPVGQPRTFVLPPCVKEYLGPVGGDCRFSVLSDFGTTNDPCPLKQPGT